MSDTIFALSSGSLPSGIAIIRLSGEHVRDVMEKICGLIPPPRQAHYTNFKAKDGMVIDQGILLFFPSPKSFTGEDCAEFHLHGSRAVIALMLQELGSFAGCRQAEPGEFARRAFAQGKMDLTQAESLADLIDAETRSQHRLAMMGARGALAALYRGWRGQLIHGRAMIEAELDFADEADVPGSISTQIWQDMAQLNCQIKQHIAEGERAGVLRDGVKIVIAGAPNAGKSSLMNRLAGRPVAIVTEEAGTTRDVLELRLVLAGLPVLIHDTAGLRQAHSKIEKIGIDMAYQRMEEADLVLMVEDMSDPQKINLPATDAEIWHIGNKCDIMQGEKSRFLCQISAQTGEGFDDFLVKLELFCRQRMAQIGELVPARQRHLDLLCQAVDDIDKAIKGEDLALELRAEHLRMAGHSLGRITGDIDVEDLLDVIFSQFCIGK